MPHPNTAQITRLYTALAAKDGAAMGACYADDARFSDPAFQNLDATGVRTMWAMLCSRATDLTVEVSGIEADDTRGKARWVASYTFSKTGQKVRNVIDAEFEFRDGLIVRHTDRFDLWRWGAQAVFLSADEPRLVTARGAQGDRPWVIVPVPRRAAN